MLYRAGWVADAGVRLVTVAHPRGVHRRVDQIGCGGIILVAVGDVVWFFQACSGCLVVQTWAVYMRLVSVAWFAAGCTGLRV